MSTKEAVRSLFTDRANEWAANYAQDGPADVSMKNLRTRQRFALELVEAALPAGARILDAGCGPGEMSSLLMARGYDVWGIDVAETMIEHARRVTGRPDRFQPGDIEQLPFPDGMFDGVVCLGVIEYLDSDSAAVRELRRVLKPGGTLVVSTPNAVCPLYRLDTVLARLTPAIDFVIDVARYRLRGRRPPVRFRVAPIGHRTYMRRSWLRQLRAEGLQPIDWRCYGWGWYRSRLGVVVDRMARAATRARQFLERRGAGRFIDRAARASSRSTLVNWVGYEQLARLRSVDKGGPA